MVFLWFGTPRKHEPVSADEGKLNQQTGPWPNRSPITKRKNNSLFSQQIIDQEFERFVLLFVRRGKRDSDKFL